jgi:alcohol dehydrogenase class IV
MSRPDDAPLSMRHVSPPFRTYAGERSLGALSKELERTGAERVMLVCGASMLRHRDLLDLAEDAIGPRLVARFSETRENSPLPSVEAAVGVLADAQADAVVGLGGGSAVVTARAAVILAAESRPARELCTRRENDRLSSPRLSAAKVPQWIVPTTPTTAYAKAGAAVRDPETDERLALYDPKARAVGVFLHPAAAATAPAQLVRSSALNAFAMCVDGLQSGVDDPVAEAQLRHALVMLRTWLPRVEEPVDGDVGVRLMVAALMAGQASDHVGTGLAQPISHALGPRASVGNGVVEALMLPHTMRFNGDRAQAALVAVAESMVPRREPSAAVAIQAVHDFLESLGVPRRLRDVGLAEADLEHGVDHVLNDWAATTVPRRATSSPACCRRPGEDRRRRWDRHEAVTIYTTKEMRHDGGA